MAMLDKLGSANTYSHCTDIVPTILESCGVKMPDTVDDQKQSPLAGVSMRYSFDNGHEAAASTPRGSRGIAKKRSEAPLLTQRRITMNTIRCRQFSVALALAFGPQAHASPETLNFVADQFSLGEALSPVSVVVRDFNRDGFLDVVTANFETSDISLLLGKSNGRFRSLGTLPGGPEARTVTAGDFNRDGIEDAVTANSGSDDVSVFLGKRPGGFEMARSFPTGEHPNDVAIGDFNRDSRLDLVTVNEFTVSILLGRGNGRFLPVGTFLAGNPWSVAVDDFNRDGIEDLITADANPDNISVLFGNGDGSFQPPQFFPTGEFPIQVALGDFNRDGAPDAVTVNEESSDIAILFGNRDGSFEAPQRFNLGDFPTTVAVGDFNRDGALDLSAIDGSPDNVVVSLGNGDGSFQTPQSFSVGERERSGTLAISVGDFNRDGALDIVTTTAGFISETGVVPDTISVLIQQTAQ